jgi:DNA-binding transcriptional regulator YbjK
MAEEFDQQDVAQLRTDVAAVKSDVSDVKSSISRIAEALTKLAVLEDRQAAQTSLIEKWMQRLENLEEKQHANELRFAGMVYSTDRIANIQSAVDTVVKKVNAIEARDDTIVGGVKIFWAVFGGAITAAITFLIMRH